MNNRLTLNLGLRYDLIDGIQIDQSKNPNFVKVQAAGAAGLLTGIKGLENAGLEPKEDTNNWQPRVGFAYDLRGDARDVIRGGWGVYQDVGYTNSNVLFPAIDATGIGSGSVFNVDNADGIRNPDGSFYQVGQPISNIASQNQANPNALPLFGQWLDPRLQMPYTRQTAFGWSHQVSSSSSFNVDFVRNDGRDLNVRPRINTRPVGQPDGAAPPGLPRPAAQRRGHASGGQPREERIHRAHHGLQAPHVERVRLLGHLHAGGSEQHHRHGGRRAQLEQHAGSGTALRRSQRVFGPTSRTDARHTGSVAMVWQGPWGINVSPIFLARSALPVSITEGLDLNGNGENNDLPAKAYAFDGVGNAPKEIGDCETWNCGRGAARWQMNLRLAKSFRLPGTMRVEAIGEIFNLFNAKNPATFRTPAACSAPACANPDFLQPTEYSGDFQNPEQRVGQIGFRFTF